MSSTMNGNGSSNNKRTADDDDDDDEKRFFIPSQSWQGPKDGYYFGTSDAGTGYYLDDDDNKNRKKKKTKRARFDESANETAVIVSAETLLQQAEEQAAGRAAGKVVTLTVNGVKAAAAALQKAVEINALQRAKQQQQQSSELSVAAAESFMDSEVALYEQIAALKAFAATDRPEKLYDALRQYVLSDLLQLLLHDNVDIAVAVVSVLLEWLGDYDDDAAVVVLDEQQQTAVTQLAAAVLQDGAELLVENLARMQQQEQESNEDDDEVGRGVEDILSLFENLLELDTAAASTAAGDAMIKMTRNGNSVAAVLAQETALVAWLFEKISQDGNDTSSLVISNRCMELLAYMAPREDLGIKDWSLIPAYTSTFAASSTHNGNSSSKDTTKTFDGIELLLQCVAKFRKKQPEGEAQIEFLENAGIVLASALTYNATTAVPAFLHAQGIELVVRCLKERVHAGAVALKWLDFSGSDAVYRTACEHLVQVGALKYIFPLFLGRNLPRYHTKPVTTAKQKKAKKEFQHNIESTAIRILYGLVRHLRDDSPHDAKERVLAKFVSDSNNNYEKMNRLVELLLLYDQKARLAEYRFFRSDIEETLQGGSSSTDDDDNKESMIQLAALDAKLAGGGDILHRLAAIAAFCCCGSKQCHQHILAQLHAKESGIGLVREALQEFVSVLSESEQKRQLESYLEQI